MVNSKSYITILHRKSSSFLFHFLFHDHYSRFLAQSLICQFGGLVSNGVWNTISVGALAGFKATAIACVASAIPTVILISSSRESIQLAWSYICMIISRLILIIVWCFSACCCSHNALGKEANLNYTAQALIIGGGRGIQASWW